jgi:hypothetical protein
MRGWLLSGAGIEDAPGRLIPSASMIAVIVLAVPMVMQVPWLRAMPFSTPAQSSSVILPARSSSQYFQESEPEPSTTPFQLPRSIGPAGRKIAGTPALMAPSSSAGPVLSQPPISTAPSTGRLRICSSASMARRLR